LAARTLFILALPVFLVTANVRWLAGDTGFYTRGFRDYNVTETTGISIFDLDRAAGEIVDYFENNANELRIIVSEDNREVSLFNAEETAHMHDVKRLMRFVFRLNEISLAYVLLYVAGSVLWSRERSLRGLAWDALSGMAVLFALIVAAGAMAAAGFDSFWTRFHEIAFPGGGWQFNPDTDHLIQMFPEQFWQKMVYTAGALTLAEVVAVVAGSLALLVLSRRPDPDARPARLRGERVRDEV
jgi:integral membrane protein (TIGR01906 family)